MTNPTAPADAGSAAITAELVRYGLEAAADQIRVTLSRIAFSSAILEATDFAAALYDKEVRLLAQANTQLGFLGTLGASVQATVARVGGAETLQDGDVLFSTYGYDIGSHQLDAVIILPSFFENELVGYAVVKAHQADLGAKDPYCSDTVDIFQEGVIFPGIRLYSAGRRNEEMYRTILANSRSPEALAGDLSAQIGSARVGLREFNRLLERFGRRQFTAATERMFDHGARVVREFLRSVPDGRYHAAGAMDDDGIRPEPVPIDAVVEVSGDEIRIDLTASADQRQGPVNSPRAATEGGMRLAVISLAGIEGSVNEGHFRPIQVDTRSGSVLDPIPPAPIFLYAWSWALAMDLVHRALAEATPDAVPAASGGDLCGLTLWGTDERGTFWMKPVPHSVGMGASSHGDMTAPLTFMPTAGLTTMPAEVQELDGHVIVEQAELAPDSGGPGRFRGGLGVTARYRTTSPQYLMVLAERSKTAPWGLHGGGPGRPNAVHLHVPGETVRRIGKVTGIEIPSGAIIEAASGGGGGFGPAGERDPAAVQHDLREGLITEAAARRDYPHGFTKPEASPGTNRERGR